MKFDYECALSGLVEPGVDDEDSDGLGDQPVGWVRVEITRRRLNPEWIQLQQIKDMMIEGTVIQYPEEIQEIQRLALTHQVKAQFWAYEQSIPKYIRDVDDVIFLSDKDQVTSYLNDFRETVGLEPLPISIEETLPIPVSEEVGSEEEEVTAEDEIEEESTEDE